VLKKTGGVASSSAFYFTKRGRAVFSAKDGSSAPSLSELLEEAIDHEGVDDIEELSDVKFLVWTKSAKLAAVTKSFAEKFSLNILDSDIVQAPNADTIVPIDSMEVAQGLDDLLAGFREYPEVKAIYANIRQGAIPDATWESIIKHIDT
jgi:transcriptional/translational regulatory protein YebC/TACO1